ncbi:pitrilysin family protein [Thalassospiraceae bacterium LMO-JJ14]|nr:pitrilysin family protein [Thalassospiraceae bacterium LMO-JJ14]
MSVRVTTLDNGMRVATDSMQNVETVTLGTWVGIGARDEAAEVNGISHLLEHMVFKGTERRTARQIAEEIEAVGGHLNAYTSRENTAYYAKVLKDDIDLAVDLVSDIVMHATMDAQELEREKSVICQEIHQSHDTPDDIVFDLFQEAAYPEQAIGRPVLGTEEIIRSLDRSDVDGYRSQSYTAPQSLFCAAGKVDHDHLVELISETFAPLPQLKANGRETARYKGGDIRLDRDLEQVHIVLGLDGVGYKDDDFYAASVLSTVFGGGMSSRLFQEVREERGLAYSIYSFLSCYEDSGIFGIYAGTGAEHLGDLIPLLVDEAHKVAKTLTAEETQRARAQLKASILMARESTSSRTEQMARHLMLFDRPIPPEEIVAKIDAVDDDAVRAVAERLFRGVPSVSAIGPVKGLESADSLSARFN